MPGSGYREPPALVRRADGQTVQLTPLLYARAGRDRRPPQRTTRSRPRSAQRSGRPVERRPRRAPSSTRKLRPLGLLRTADGSRARAAQGPTRCSRLQLPGTSSPTRSVTRRLTAPFARAVPPARRRPGPCSRSSSVCWWVLFREGPGRRDARGVRQARAAPAGLRGHGPLRRLPRVRPRGRRARTAAPPRASWAPGLYLVWPAFYTDVDRLLPARPGRAGAHRPRRPVLQRDRGRRDLRRLVGSPASDALLLVVATQILQMLRQLAPLVRFDGYHVLADLTGVPDLFQQIKPTLPGLLPVALARPGGPAAQAVGPGRDDGLGARRRTAAAARPWCCMVLALPRVARHRVGEPAASSADAARPAPGRRRRRCGVAVAGARRSSPSRCRSSAIGLHARPPGRRRSRRGRGDDRRQARSAARVAGARRGRCSWPGSPGPGGRARTPTGRSSRTSAARSLDAVLARRRRPGAAAAPRPSGHGRRAARRTVWPEDAALAARPRTTPRARAGAGAARRRRPTSRARRRARAGATAPTDASRRPGSSRSTCRCAPARATTRRSPSTPRTARVVYDVAFALVWVEDGDGR